MVNQNLKGRYQLIATGPDNYREYFNFEGRKRFVPKEWVTFSNVKLACIDSLTCLFENEYDFKCALHDGMEEDRDKLSIIYNVNGERKLYPVYNDEELKVVADRAIAKTGGTTIDKDDITTRRIMNSIFREIQNKSSNFSYEAANSQIVNEQLNNHSKEVIDKFNYDTAYTKRSYNAQFQLFMAAFESYKEFRALYLAYKSYYKRMNKHVEIEKPVSKEKTLEKTKTFEPAPGQISMYDLLNK